MAAVLGAFSSLGTSHEDGTAHSDARQAKPMGMTDRRTPVIHTAPR